MDIIEFMNGEPGRYSVHVQDNLNLHILCMFDGTFLLDTAQIMIIILEFEFLQKLTINYDCYKHMVTYLTPVTLTTCVVFFTLTLSSIRVTCYISRTKRVTTTNWKETRKVNKQCLLYTHSPLPALQGNDCLLINYISPPTQKHSLQGVGGRGITRTMHFLSSYKWNTTRGTQLIFFFFQWKNEALVMIITIFVHFHVEIRKK